MAISRDNSAIGDSDDEVVIARIVKARGIRGEVACDIETDFPERYDGLERATVRMPDSSRLELEVENHWFHKDRVIFKFAGYDTMTAAERLVGGILVIPESECVQLEEGEFYEFELIGAEVVTAEGLPVGRVIKLMGTAAGDLLVVDGYSGREQLIPFVDDICTDVDTAAKRITITPPAGLLDL